MSTRSGGLWTEGFGAIGATLRALEEAGVGRKQLLRLRTSQPYAEDVARFMTTGEMPANWYPLVADYGRPLDRIIAAGKYDHVGHDITTAHFPPPRRGKQNVVVQLVPLVVSGGTITSQEALLKLEMIGLRPANFYELLALGNAHPKVQEPYYIGALGAEYLDGNGVVQYVCLRRHEQTGRCLYLESGRWYTNSCRFAAVGI